jgi:4-hydroxy-3-methylbut-2-en-1-yl diphosphate synthase IspG/GcpE
MKSQIPVIADIHFQPNYVYAAIDAVSSAICCSVALMSVVGRWG